MILSYNNNNNNNIFKDNNNIIIVSNICLKENTFGKEIPENQVLN